MPDLGVLSTAGEAATAELVQATPAQQAQRWRLHHATWGDGFDLPLYLQREQALAEADFCRDAQRMWLLVDGHGAVLASCETYTSSAWTGMPGGALRPIRLETVASVLVEPRLRNQGFAARLMHEVRDQLQFERCAAVSLYSDVGSPLYRRAGWLLHPARSSTRAVAATEAWPTPAGELGIGDVADLLREASTTTSAWLAEVAAPAMAEVPAAVRIAWFHLRAQYRAWARGQHPAQLVGAVGPDGGCALWSADLAEPVLSVLLWRPNGPDDAAALTQAAMAQAAEQGLRRVEWWDADRDTGLDPYRQPAWQPTGALARDRDKALPMLCWLGAGMGEGPMPLVWGGVERFGWG